MVDLDAELHHSADILNISSYSNVRTITIYE